MAYAERYARLMRGCKRVISMEEAGYRIRKLTPLECWRLQAFDDRDFFAAKLGSREEADRLINKRTDDNSLSIMHESDMASITSNTQLYKQAGNSICVGCLYHIYKQLYNAMPYLFDDLRVGSYFSGIGAFEKGLDMLFEDISKESAADV